MTEPVYSPGHETCNHGIYGMPCEEFERLLARADGRCEICRILAEDTPRGILCVDHDGRYGWTVVRAILTVLAQHGRRSTTQVALLAGYSHKSGGYRNSLSSLRSAGYIEGRGEIEATAAGLTALGAYTPLPSGRALLDWWYGQLGKAERSILAAVVEVWPRELTVEEIAERTGYSVTSGGFRNALSRLRSLELASGRGSLVAAGVLGEARDAGR